MLSFNVFGFAHETAPPKRLARQRDASRHPGGGVHRVLRGAAEGRVRVENANLGGRPEPRVAGLKRPDPVGNRGAPRLVSFSGSWPFVA